MWVKFRCTLTFWHLYKLNLVKPKDAGLGSSAECGSLNDSWFKSILDSKRKLSNGDRRRPQSSDPFWILGLRVRNSFMRFCLVQWKVVVIITRKPVVYLNYMNNQHFKNILLIGITNKSCGICFGNKLPKRYIAKMTTRKNLLPNRSC